jgi:hypothetical protein
MEMSQGNSLHYIAILNKQECLFFKNGEQEGKMGPVWGWYQWEGRGYKERV